jgi:hypothetical protein
VDLDKEEASTAFQYQCILFQVTNVFSRCPWVFTCNFGKAMGLKATSSSVSVLNAKGGEIKAKATRSATTC